MSACPGTVAQQVARSAVFGDEIMKICTLLGSKECKALPQSGLWSIKCAIFKEYPQYWHCPEGFEETWKKLLNRHAAGCVEKNQHSTCIYKWHVTQKHSPTFILPYLPEYRSHRCISRTSKIQMLDKTFKSTGV